MTREELQGIAAHVLSKETRLICQWATGTGKTAVALKFLEANPGFDALIVVPEENNIENWRYEFKKFGVDDSHVTIICYASLHKYQNSNWYLLVLDEVPHMDTEKRISHLKSIKASYVRALGAVVDEDERQSLEYVYGKFHVSDVSLESAITQGILSPPKVFVLHLQMDDSKYEYWLRGKRYTAKGYYVELQNKVNKAVNDYNSNANSFNKRRMLVAGNERKRFLGLLKEDAIRRICHKLQENNKRFICFCSSINQANALGGENAFTSESAKSMKHLEKFNNHEIDSLFVVGKCIEGQNLRDIECGIIGQLGGTSRITVQECGRILRSSNPIIYVPIFDGTKDESFLYTLTSNIPNNYIKHYKF